jgi:predicted CxxxxCH...CXXCH cytochrome family protein
VSSATGVGAHQKHLRTGTIGKTVKCMECHRIPAVWNAPGHIDSDMRAEVAFNDTLARLASGDGTLTPSPAYDRSALTCANTYCHGDWRIRKATSASQYIYRDTLIVGNNASPRWTSGTAESVCNKCHGIAPVGHEPYTETACTSCHTGITDANGNIQDRTKHIDGKIVVFGIETPFR